ncbi:MULTISPECIES: hypothetical protein [unclassified Bradyrhizobium]|nr:MULTISPECIES: hypothetical protein [unclassified Bradyrhizobium]WGR73858.1 tripartite tricarboxylate transporter permease [Bradyrhizobium sp. ISRA426]WGR78695.1 tripartite tricarboxylate transporter permease [Bradyrhizobium sp. ISRA430]WGR89097.1 tripartite tricarboxylate transporter permease [Bradyrhizobium sp. ISRA432]
MAILLPLNFTMDPTSAIVRRDRRQDRLAPLDFPEVAHAIAD